MDNEDGKPTFTADDLAHIKGDDGAGDGTGTDGARADKGSDKSAADAAGKDAKAGDGKTGDDKAAEGDGKAPAGKDASDGADKGDGKPGAAAAAGKDGKDAKTEGDGKGKDGKDEDYLPADWRVKELARLERSGLTGDALKKAQDIIKRVSSPAELVRKAVGFDSKITEATEAAKGRIKIPSGKGDDPKEVEAFDKAWGVPESAEKYTMPEAPEELGERTDFDKELIGEALKDFHGAHFNQAQVDVAIKAFDRAQQIVKRQMVENAAKADDTSDEELRAQHLRDYRPNVELANRALETGLGKYLPEKADRLGFLDMRLQDGTRIGNYVPFVNFMIDIAKNGFSAVADDGAPIEGASSGAVDLDKRIGEILALSHTGKSADEAKYKQLQPELEKLMTAKVRRDQEVANKR